MVSHSSILACRISLTEESGGQQPIGSEIVGHDCSNSWHVTHTIFFVPRSQSFCIHPCKGPNRDLRDSYTVLQPKRGDEEASLEKKKKSLTQASMGKLILKKNISSLHSILLFYSKLLHLCPIGSLAVSHFYCPALTTVCNHWKKQSFDYIYYTDLCQQSNVSAF